MRDLEKMIHQYLNIIRLKIRSLMVEDLERIILSEYKVICITYMSQKNACHLWDVRRGIIDAKEII